MAEFVDGFQLIADFEKSAAIFGSTRALPENPYYKEAQKLAGLLAKEGYTVITGGGPGIMEAGNRGAFEAGGESVGLNIELAEGQMMNKYVTRPLGFHYFFIRKTMFYFACSVYIFFPGGFGTLDEFFELVELVQTKKLGKKVLIITVGKDYWQPLFDWFKSEVYQKRKAIDEADLKIFQLADSSQEVLDIIRKNNNNERG